LILNPRFMLAKR